MFVEHKYKGTKQYDLVYERLKLVAENRQKTDYSAVFAIMKLTPGNHAAKLPGSGLAIIHWRTVLEGLRHCLKRPTLPRPGCRFATFCLI